MIRDSKTNHASHSRFAARFGAAIPAALDASMADLAHRTRGRMAKDTGQMAESVRAVPARGNPVVLASVVVASGHAAAQEFGTATVRPRPSFRPSIRENQERQARTLPQFLRRLP